MSSGNATIHTMPTKQKVILLVKILRYAMGKEIATNRLQAIACDENIAAYHRYCDK